MLQNSALNTFNIQVKSIKNFYDFTVDSFKLVDYKFNEKKYSIPVAE